MKFSGPLSILATILCGVAAYRLFCTVSDTLIERFGAVRIKRNRKINDSCLQRFAESIHRFIDEHDECNFRASRLIFPVAEMFSDIHRGFMSNTCDRTEFIKTCPTNLFDRTEMLE